MSYKHWLNKNKISASANLKISTSVALFIAAQVADVHCLTSLACVVTPGIHVAVQVMGAAEPRSPK